MIKKGEMTLEELIKLILAVAGIAVLLLLAFNLYKMFSVKTQAEQAKIHLERIEKSLKKMNLGQDTEYLITGLKGWYLVGYEALETDPSNPLGEFHSTISCDDEDCICFCDLGDDSVRGIVGGPAIDGEVDRRPTVNYFFYQKVQSIQYGPQGNKGYDYCESNSVCLKIKGIKIQSKEPEMDGFFVPWIRLNNSATNIKIAKRTDHISLGKIN